MRRRVDFYCSFNHLLGVLAIPLTVIVICLVHVFFAVLGVLEVVGG